MNTSPLKAHTRLIVPLLACALSLTACGQDQSGPHGGEDVSHDLPNLDLGHALTDDQLANSGIKTSAPTSTKVTTTLTLPAMAVEDLDEQAHVNSILPGVVTRVAADLGHEVDGGALMCTIRSAVLAQAVSDIHTARAVLASSMRMQEKELAVLDRCVELAQGAEHRERELAAKGFGTARQLADAKAALQQAELERDRRILELEQKIAKENELLSASMSKLAAWGFNPDYLNTQDAAIGQYSLYASKPGVVMGRHITEGEFVDTQTQLFLIQGMREVWMLASVFENQIRFVDEGAAATVRFNAYPDLVIEGTVDHIHHDLDVDTRSVKARVKVRNRPLAGRNDEHPLLPGMYGSIEVRTGEVMAKTAVPTGALLKEGNREYLFTKDRSGVFRRRFVETGLRTSDVVQITSDLPADEEVVVEGMFALESILHTDTVNEHDH